MNKSLKLAGVVVLYNPDNDVVSHISTYKSFLELLVIVDNSDQQNNSLVKVLNAIPNVVYQKNKTNEGVAQALNIGAKIAITNGCNFLLTMDQDSRFIDGSFKELLSVMENLDFTKVGIVAPSHKFASGFNLRTNNLQEVNFTMTSGNLLNLDIYEKTGEFLEFLFIDHIDHEYGLRLNSLGYKVIQVNSVILKHDLGQIKTIKFFNFNLAQYVSHQALRGYYMSRNGFYVAKKYREQYWKFTILNLKLIFLEILKAIFLEDNRALRLKYLWKGYKDYHNGKLGRISDN